MYNYKARYYDPALGRFISADTVTPGGTEGLNRYSYTSNNPVKYSDPSGHKACDGEGTEDTCQGVTNDDLTELVSFSYGWQVEGAWTTYKLDKLLNFASDFASDIFNVTGNDGSTWIKNHVGNATLYMGESADWILDRFGAPPGMVLNNRDVLLRTNFASTDYGESTLIHEMGHVLDNNVKNGVIPATYLGGGPADAMVSAMGGNPGDCTLRFKCGDKRWYRDNIAGSYAWPEQSYANTGVAEDFADTFMSTVMGNSAPRTAPAIRQLWIASFLRLLP